MYDGVIIGAGASGLVAAITAKQSGKDILLIDRMDRVGKKILVTGNGRCNLSNECISSEDYNTEARKLIDLSYKKIKKDDIINFFRTLGLELKSEENKLFPMSLKASSVVDILRYEIDSLNIPTILSDKVKSIKKNADSFIVELESNKKIKSKKLVIATGGKSYPNLGSDGSGYDLAKSLGHNIIKPIPGLVQIKSNNKLVKSLQGIKLDARISLLKNARIIKEESGEVLFTNYGLSGPSIIQISRYIKAIKGNKYKLRLDLMPEIDINGLKNLLYMVFNMNPKKPIDIALSGIINKKVGIILLKKINKDIKATEPCSYLNSDDILNLCKEIKSLEIEVDDFLGFKEAQITRGGVDLMEISGNLESKLCNGLFFIGEVLNVDGRCGGYNLTWAWTSGMIVGENI